MYIIEYFPPPGGGNEIKGLGGGEGIQRRGEEKGKKMKEKEGEKEGGKRKKEQVRERKGRERKKRACGTLTTIP